MDTAYTDIYTLSLHDALPISDRKKILVISGTQKKPNGEPVTWFINYDELMNGKNVQKNNILINPGDQVIVRGRSEEHTSELQSRRDLVCRLLLEKKKKTKNHP